MTVEEQTNILAQILLKEAKKEGMAERWLKTKIILSLLATGATLAVSLAAPGAARAFRFIPKELKFDDDWRTFNKKYLLNTIRRMEKQKVVEIVKYNEKGYGIIKITDVGRQKLVKHSVDSITIHKPAIWDGLWRMVFYDVSHKQAIRDKFRNYLLAGGFYRLQESVFIHAYPCEEEIEFLKNYLGIGSEVRIVTATKIENDQQFKNFFGV